jgi:hypothetical protein
MAQIVAFAAVIAVLVGSAAAGTFEVLRPTSYKQLDPVKGQWAISVAATRSPDKTVFTPQVCDQDKFTAACNQPLLSADAKDKLQVTATLTSSPLKTIDNLPAKKVVFRACYTKPSIADRPWRKSNNVIDKDKSCPFTMKSMDINGTSYTVEWPIPKGMTRAAFYTQVMVQCMNGTEPAFCQYDTTKNQTYFGATMIDGTPKGMIVATAVCSAIGPLFLGSYFIKDMLSRKKQ